jgi:hypothetical protein
MKSKRQVLVRAGDLFLRSLDKELCALSKWLAGLTLDWVSAGISTK